MSSAVRITPRVQSNCFSVCGITQWLGNERNKILPVGQYWDFFFWSADFLYKKQGFKFFDQ